MKKNKLWVLVVFASMLIGCGTAAVSVEMPEKTADEIADSVLTAYSNEMEQQDVDTVIKLLGLEKDKVQEAAGYMGKQEKDNILLVVISENEEEAAVVNDSMNYYLDTLENTAEMYSPKQLESIKNAYITTKGNISLMAVSDDMSKVKKAVISALQ